LIQTSLLRPINIISIMRKRNFLMGLLAATTVPVFAQSTDAVSPTPNAIKPYLQVPSYKPDANVVRIFFSPTCPYSRQYLSFFKNLESSLNSKTAKESIFTPTTNLSDGIEYAMAFAAVRRFHSRYAQNFIDASMIAAQEKNINVFNFRGINIIASAVGFGRTKQLPESLITLIAKNKALLYLDVQDYQAAQKALQIIGTPSVSVAGTYVVSPEFTMGDPERFSELINAVISMSL